MDGNSGTQIAVSLLSEDERAELISIVLKVFAAVLVLDGKEKTLSDKRKSLIIGHLKDLSVVAINNLINGYKISEKDKDDLSKCVARYEFNLLHADENAWEENIKAGKQNDV